MTYRPKHGWTPDQPHTISLLREPSAHVSLNRGEDISEQAVLWSVTYFELFKLSHGVQFGMISVVNYFVFLRLLFFALLLLSVT